MPVRSKAASPITSRYMIPLILCRHQLAYTRWLVLRDPLMSAVWRMMLAFDNPYFGYGTYNWSWCLESPPEGFEYAMVLHKLSRP